MKVLIVDDDSTSAQVLSRILRGYGHECQIAVSGEQAIDLVSASSPDLILMDIMMNGIGGIEAVKQIRSGGYVGKMAMLTAMSGNEEVDSATAAGADSYIVKGSTRTFDQVRDIIHKTALARMQ